MNDTDTTEMNEQPEQEKSRGDRTPDSELKRRIKQVTDLMVAGVSDSDIVKFCGEKWEVHYNTAKRYLSEANERLRDAYNHDTRTESEKALRRYQDLYYKARASGDLRTAANIQDKICKLLQLTEDVVRHEAGDTLTEFLQGLRKGRNA